MLARLCKCARLRNAAALSKQIALPMTPTPAPTPSASAEVGKRELETAGAVAAVVAVATPELATNGEPEEATG